MTVCIDTNVVLGMFAAGHPYRPIHDAWLAGRLEWAVSTEILLEYEEVTQRRSGKARADKMMRLIETVGGLHGNVKRISPTFRFRLITNDPDDDKFVDTAIAAAARYIITNDGDFSVIAGKSGRPAAITPSDFIRDVLPLL
jgi:uncharacterized protein